MLHHMKRKTLGQPSSDVSRLRSDNELFEREYESLSAGCIHTCIPGLLDQLRWLPEGKGKM
jgi:hypothetical protein